MANPLIAHQVDIHIDSTSGAVLSGTNKLEEFSSCNVSGAHTVQPRQNLNSDGHTLQGVTWHEYSGSLEGRVLDTSTVQDTITEAAMAGTAAFISIIDKPDAAEGERKGYRYEVYFENHDIGLPAGDYVTISASFKVSGAPTEILVPETP